MTEREDIDMVAAEYVLGTLDVAERTAVSARRLREPALEAAIRDWERRLAPFADDVAPVPPPADLFERIRERMLDGPAAQPLRDLQLGDEAPHIRTLERRVGFWRRATVAATALAATLAVAFGFRDTLLPPGVGQQNFVAVFQKDDQQPAFLLAVDLKTREVTIRPVTAEPQTERTYQLWIVDPNVSPVPRSLGLIESSLRSPTRKVLASIEPAVLQRATFGISLEPPGGSPTGRPTGPALHGRLLPATP